MVDFADNSQRQRRQMKRIEAFNNSLSQVYRDFNESKFPRPDIAQVLFAEWQSLEPEHENSKFGEGGLVLHGPPRSGKTQLACELVRQRLAVDLASDAKFVSAVEWGSECSQRAKGCLLAGWTNRIISSIEILLIDDLDKLKATASVQSELFNLIEQATANDVDLIVTTNVTSRQLANKFDAEFGEAIVARLNEFCVPVSFSK